MKTDTELARVLRVKTGDTVCDCRYRHMKIAAVEPEYGPRPGLEKLSPLLPQRLYEFLRSVWPKRVYDLQLTLEDGAQCSARHCCDALPHPPGVEDPAPGASDAKNR